VTERQKILRLLMKEVVVDRDSLTIRHSIYALPRFWLPPVVPSHEARGPGRPPIEKRSLIQRKLAPRGHSWGRGIRPANACGASAYPYGQNIRPDNLAPDHV
jgi:hypothetical protein